VGTEGVCVSGNIVWAKLNIIEMPGNGTEETEKRIFDVAVRLIETPSLVRALNSDKPIWERQVGDKLHSTDQARGARTLGRTSSRIGGCGWLWDRFTPYKL